MRFDILGGAMYGGGHMGYSSWGILMTATWLVWLVVGILLIVYLWKKINNGK